MQAPSRVEVLPDDARQKRFDQHTERPRVRGKFLFAGDKKIFVKGVTYGTFRPNSEGHDYPNPEVVDQDFQQMRVAGINTVRLYTVPPRWLLDIALSHGLRAIVGLPWEQHVAFLSDAAMRRSIIERVQQGVETCAGHQAVLAYTIGNEIPAQVVRWHGARRVERFLEELFWTVKVADPGALVTYANFPSTEYLELPFLDFSLFNVYLESHAEFDGYVGRLQNLSSDKPLVIGELGLDSRRNGEVRQADALEDQLRTAFARGCAGACAFAWTDEWHRGGFDVEDWDFGLTRRDRRPKPALAAIDRVYAEVPFPASRHWPRMSVVVCSRNGAATIGDCLAGVSRLDYPDYETIVVDDGSTDATASIAAEFEARVIRTPNQGLSRARNVGMRAATGEIIAYIDDDACPDPHWLMYLAETFLNTSHAAVGGPNLSPPGDGFIAEAVDCSPGNPVHVLLTDEVAEHIPGCNMAVRKANLEAIGGFDPQFRVAGDDVDLCWRLQERGWTIGLAPGAVVWHHRRNSIRGYWRQQIGYGRSEALLERKWPEKYSVAGHQIWSGRVYGGVDSGRLLRGRQRIYQGVWGTAAYQSTHEDQPGFFASLVAMPEWYAILSVLAGLTMLSLHWQQMILFAPVLAFAATSTAVHVSRGSVSSTGIDAMPTAARRRRIARRACTTFLGVLQPIARLWGRFSHGLTPWRCASPLGYAWPRPMTYSLWSQEWCSNEQRLRAIQAQIRNDGYVVRPSDGFDDWDLEVRGGLGAVTRVQMLTEEHGQGYQFVRLRSWQRYSPVVLLFATFFGALCIIAILDRAWIAAPVLGILAAILLLQVAREASGSAAAARAALRQATQPRDEPAQVNGGSKSLNTSIPNGIAQVVIRNHDGDATKIDLPIAEDGGDRDLIHPDRH